jgi:hypothetical protein
LKGRIQNPRVDHDNRIDFCIIAITFIEQKIGEEIAPDFSVKLEVESAFITAPLSVLKVIKTPFNPSLLKKFIDKKNSLVSQFASFSSSVRSGIAQIQQALGKISNFYAGIMIPVDSVVHLVEFGSTLPDLICESTVQAIVRCAEAIRKTVQSPSIFLNSINNNITILLQEVSSVVPDNTIFESIKNSCMIHLAQYASVVVANYYNDDEKLRDTYEQEMNKTVFDIEGTVISDFKPITIYNENELEKSLYEVRKLLYETMNLDRDNLLSHKTIAYNLERHVNKVKLNRDRIITFNIGLHEKPLHLLCREQGLNHRYDLQIMAINNIPNPFFCSGLINMYERER